MDEFRRRKADELHGKRGQRLPYFGTAAKETLIDRSLRRFPVILFQGGGTGQRIEEIAVKADSCLFVDEFGEFLFIRPSVRADQAIEGLKQIRVHYDRPGIQIHIVLAVDGAQLTKAFFTLLVKELAT